MKKTLKTSPSSKSKATKSIASNKTKMVAKPAVKKTVAVAKAKVPAKKNAPIEKKKNLKRKVLAYGGAVAAMTGTVASVVACTPEFEEMFIDTVGLETGAGIGTGTGTGTGTVVETGDKGITKPEAQAVINNVISSVSTEQSIPTSQYSSFKTLFDEITSIKNNVKMFEEMFGQGDQTEEITAVQITALKRLETVKIMKLMNNVLNVPFNLTNNYHATMDSVTALPDRGISGQEMRFTLKITESKTGATSKMNYLRLKLAHPIQLDTSYQLTASETAARAAVNKNDAIFSSNYIFSASNYQLFRTLAIENQSFSLYATSSADYILGALKSLFMNPDLEYAEGTSMFVNNAFVLPETVPRQGKVSLEFVFYSKAHRHITFTKTISVTIL